MDLKEIQNLIKFVTKSGASEVKLEMDDVKIPNTDNYECTTGEKSTTQMAQGLGDNSK